MTEPQYNHQDSSRLSYSGAKILLEPGGPAKYRAAMDGPRVQKREFDLGHAVHAKVLGKGAGVVVLDFDAYTTKAAREAKAAAYDAGLVPLLAQQAAEVDAAAEAVLAHKAARKIYESGEPEQSITWESDDATPMRGQIDWWARDMWLLNDLKTTTDASRRGFAKSCAAYHYEIQAWAYTEGVEVLGHDPHVFTWTVVELKPPFLCAVYEPDEALLETGRVNLRTAQAIWNRCRETGEWPGLDDDVQTISLPPWALREEYVA